MAPPARAELQSPKHTWLPTLYTFTLYFTLYILHHFWQTRQIHRGENLYFWGHFSRIRGATQAHTFPTGHGRSCGTAAGTLCGRPCDTAAGTAQALNGRCSFAGRGISHKTSGNFHGAHDNAHAGPGAHTKQRSYSRTGWLVLLSAQGLLMWNFSPRCVTYIFGTSLQR